MLTTLGVIVFTFRDLVGMLLLGLVLGFVLLILLLQGWEKLKTKFKKGK